MAAALIALALAIPAGAQQVLVDFGSTTRWLANSSSPGLGITWTAEGFDDSSWTTGTFGIGYESGTGAEALVTTIVPDTTVSVYTRTRFTVPDLAAIDSLSLAFDWDDGVVAWLNGVEIWRSPEVPPGTLSWDEAVDPHESSNAAAPAFGPPVSVPLSALRAGENVLAVGVWNADVPSSDLVLVPRLVANDRQALTRGPYLQLATPTAITIRWRTLNPAASVVRWGGDPASLTESIVVAGARTEHEVRIEGLLPRRPYFYSVGTEDETLAGGDAAHQFLTPPAAGMRLPVHAWILGDSGTANADARRVRDAWRAWDAGRAPDLWLLLGDNAYDDGTDSQYQRAVFDVYGDELRRSPAWPTFGNHDALSASATTQSGAYFDAFTLPAAGEAGGIASGTEAYYSFDWANVHFVCLDSQESARSATGPMASWLRRDLAATGQEWLIAYFHHGPYTKGSHDSDTEPRHVEMRQAILPILEDFGVDLVLSGHSHSYERSFLVDGHYGTSDTLSPAHVIDGGFGDPSIGAEYRKPAAGLAARSGEVFVVAGSSGKTEAGPLNHPVMVVSLEVLGSFVLDVTGAQLDGTFLDDRGNVRDSFRIVKDPGPLEDCFNGVDDDRDGETDCADIDCSLDSDGDRVPDCADCAPSDPGARSVPAEVEFSTVRGLAGGVAQLRWNDPRPGAGPDLVADVATGEILRLHADRGLASATCLARDLGSDELLDPRPAPASSDGWWYLVRARNACGSGAWGPSSSPVGCP